MLKTLHNLAETRAATPTAVVLFIPTFLLLVQTAASPLCLHDNSLSSQKS